jgi:hypothetical protein
LENFKILQAGNLEIVFMLCKKAKTGKSDPMRKCDAKMRKNSHRIASLKDGKKTGKLID